MVCIICCNAYDYTDSLQFVYEDVPVYYIICEQGFILRYRAVQE